MVMIFLFLRVQHNRSQTVLQKLLRIDYGGNFILVGSTVAILYALTYAGTKYPWTAASVLAPLIIGLAGMVLFMWYERAVAAEPVVPPTLFQSRTTSIIFAATFLNSLLLYWIIFFLPVYSQAVLGTSAARAGVLLLPAVLFGIPGAIVAVLLLAKFGKYKPLHLIGFAISVLGLGLFTLLDQNTSLAKYIVFQAVVAIGGGFVLNTLLPAVQAQLDEKYQAATTSAWSFMRSLGSIWGVAVPAAVFNNRFGQIAAYTITDPAARALFDSGNGAYENARADLIWSLAPQARDQIVQTYSDALKLIWQISIAFSAVNFLIIIFEEQVTLRTELETEFGLEGGRKEVTNNNTKSEDNQTESKV